jgi:hypothetical protein
MYNFTGRVTLLVVLVSAGTAVAQSLPTSQPNVLQIVREEVKVGHDADHTKTEAAAIPLLEKTKFPYFAIALVALTGQPEAWFVLPYDSQAALGDSMKRLNEDPGLAPDFARLARADAEHITGTRTILAVGRKDLSHGAFPDAGKQRFYDVTIFRVRPGHEPEFQAAAKAYGAAADRSVPATSYRVYQVTAGMPTPTFLVFSSVGSFADFDKLEGQGDALMKAASADERSAFQKFFSEALISQETQRFRVDPEMSYVPKEVRAQDPDFWMPKKPAVKRTSSDQR